MDNKKKDGDGAVADNTEVLKQLQAQFDELTETNKANVETIDSLKENNKKIVEEKREEEDKANKERKAKMSAGELHDELLKEERAKFTKMETQLLDNHATALGKVDTLLKKLNGSTGEAVLKATLDAVGVTDTARPLVESHFRATMTFDDDGIAMHDDKALATSIKEWAACDAGKPFIKSDNSGGGEKPNASNKHQEKPGKKLTFEERKDKLLNGEDIN